MKVGKAALGLPSGTLRVPFGAPWALVGPPRHPPQGHRLGACPTCVLGAAHSVPLGTPFGTLGVPSGTLRVSWHYSAHMS